MISIESKRYKIQSDQVHVPMTITDLQTGDLISIDPAKVPVKRLGIMTEKAFDEMCRSLIASARHGR